MDKAISSGPLNEEIKTYERNKDNLVKESNGKYVLIKGNEIIGIYDTQNDAIKVGIDKFGNTPFLVKKIEAVEQPMNFTSNLIKLETPCPQ